MIARLASGDSGTRLAVRTDSGVHRSRSPDADPTADATSAGPLAGSALATRHAPSAYADRDRLTETAGSRRRSAMNASAPASSPQPPAPRITVVVLSRNHVRQTVDTVARLTALPEAPCVIVADNGSSDSTVSLLGSLFPRVRIVQGLRDLGTAGFNRAIALVSTDYVACCDDSTWWAPGALARAIGLLDADPRVAVLNARIVGDDEREIHPGCLMLGATSPGVDGLGAAAPGAASDATVQGHAAAGAGVLPAPALARFMAGACVLRTRVFRAVGGYDERLAAGAAEDLAALDMLSAGHAIVYCEEALAHREPLTRWITRSQHCTLARNAAWVAWMRLPARDALRATGHALAVFARQHSLGPAGIALFRGAFWALPRRRVVPREVALLARQVRRAERHVRAGIPAMAEKPDRSGQRAW